MKKILLFALVAMVAVSCSKEENTGTNSDEIQFNVGLATKAPISGAIPGTALANIQILRAPDAATAVWTGVRTVTTTADIAQTTGTVTPDTPQFYNTNGTAAWFMAYYPLATMLSTDKVSWTITGQEDIIIAPSVSAGTKATKTGAALAFTHKLSQLIFKVKAASPDAIASWGTVTYIKVNGATALELKPSTGAFTVATTPANADLVVGAVIYPITLTTTAQLAGSLMLFPSTLGAVKVKTSLGLEQIIPITTLTNLVAGQSHEIELTFTATGITFTATLSDWTAGTSGSGNVQ